MTLGLLYPLIAAAFLIAVGVYLVYPLMRYWRPMATPEKRTARAVVANMCTLGACAFGACYFARTKPYAAEVGVSVLCILFAGIARGVFAIRKRNTQQESASKTAGREASCR